MIIRFLNISPVRHNLRAMESYLYTWDDPAWKIIGYYTYAWPTQGNQLPEGEKKTICIYETILPTKSQPKLSSMNIIYQPILIEKEYQSSMHILASSWAYWATARGDLKIKGGTWKSYLLPSDKIRATVLHPDHEENEEAIGEADAKQSVDEKAADVFLRMCM